MESAEPELGEEGFTEMLVPARQEGIERNLPQEAPREFAEPIIDVAEV
jgi:hypothetical protein